MLGRRRLSLAASTVLVCGSLVVSGCSLAGGEPGGDSSGTGTSQSGSATDGSSTTSSGTQTSTPDDEESTTDPTSIDCDLADQRHIDQWTRGGKDATVEPTDDGCRVVSSSEAGAVLVEWRWLDAYESGADARLLQKQEREGDLVTVAPGIEGRRVESEAAPTRKSQTSARIGNRYLYVESTVTLDRHQTMEDLRKVARQLSTTYADVPPPPIPTES